MRKHGLEMVAAAAAPGAAAALKLRERRTNGSKQGKASGPRSSDDDLSKTIEERVIPRLLLALASSELEREVEGGCPDMRMPPTETEIAELANLAVSQDMETALDRIESMSRAGLSLETLLVEYVSSAARRLGEQWLSDDRSFAEVTLGLGFLQRVVSVLGHDVAPPIAHRGLVILVAPRGEQHTLAIQILGELLRQAGWGAQVEPGLDESDLLDMVANEPVTMVGLSVSHDRMVERLPRIVAEIKRHSMNPDIAVMVGGAADLSEVAGMIGAVHSPDARHALEWLEQNERRLDGSAEHVG